MDKSAQPSPVTVYWRPGCSSCARLRRDLRRVGLPTMEINIWDDAEGAAVVQSIAGGNETVPTVVIGDRGLINPSARTVLDAVGTVAPDLIAAYDGHPPLHSEPHGLKVAQWLVVAGGIAASLGVESAGHTGLSWILDAVTLAAYVVLRRFRQRSAALG